MLQRHNLKTRDVLRGYTGTLGTVQYLCTNLMSQTRRLNSTGSVRQRPGPHKIHNDIDTNGLNSIGLVPSA